MALVQYAGYDILNGQLHIPTRGPWWFNGRLDTTTVPAIGTQGTLLAQGDGGINLVGTVVKSGVFLDAVDVRIVGGAAGLGVTMTPNSYRNALLRDPLNSALDAAGETLSSTVSSSILSLSLPYWSVINETAMRVVDLLASAAAAQLGKAVNWRPLSDGTIWLGTETYPSQSLPSGSDVLWQHPVSPWFEIGGDTLSLLPGVNLTDIGGLNVVGVDHWIEPSRIRSWAWT